MHVQLAWFAPKQVQHSAAAAGAGRVSCGLLAAQSGAGRPGHQQGGDGEDHVWVHKVLGHHQVAHRPAALDGASHADQLQRMEGRGLGVGLQSRSMQCAARNSSHVASSLEK